MEIKHWKVTNEDKPNLNLTESKTVFCSFTYITPNYSILFVLNELKKFVDLTKDSKIFIVLWDMNTLSNPYFKRLCGSGIVKDPKEFMDNRVNEIRKIMLSLGFEKSNFSIYKSSDLWKRFINYSKRNIFQEFYSVLAQLKINDFTENVKVSHLVQIPLDIFFCNYFHEFYPEDVSQPIEVAFLGKDKEKLYKSTRELMIKEGFIKQKNPLLVEVDLFASLLYNNNLPEWNMKKREIKDFIVNIELSSKDVLTLLSFTCSKENLIKLGGSELDYEKFCQNYPNKNTYFLKEVLIENLFDYLQSFKIKYDAIGSDIEEEIVNILNEKEIMEIGKVLRSKIALKIVFLSDGTRNTTQISKELKKSIATISMYTNALKKQGLIKVLSDGKLKRNIKGIKVNFEFGLNK
ncbi:MAG: helix-turn-helix domain-containing protein [Candidatus Pacearchaeota archaeon]|jgi:hypothetical protein